MFLTVSLQLLLALPVFAKPEISADQFLKADRSELLSFVQPRADGVFYYQYPTEFQEDSDLGYRHSSSVTVRHIERTVDKVIFDARYSLDKFGRRFHPEHTPDGKASFVVLSGGSYTYGTGLNDDETLSYFMNSLSSTHHVYNYGIAASGPHMALALTESGRFKKEIPQNNGIMIHTYIHAHIQRANGFMNELSWLKGTPCYEKSDNGRYIRNGSFETCSPFRTWALLKLDSLLQGTPFYRNFPSLQPEHLEKTCQLMAQMKEAFKKQYPKGQFFVFMHPLIGPDIQAGSMKDCLQRKKVRYLTMMTGPDRSKIYTIQGDGHPNARFNREAAEVLMNQLREAEVDLTKGSLQ